jgi:hypothetical protein
MFNSAECFACQGIVSICNVRIVRFIGEGEFKIQKRREFLNTALAAEFEPPSGSYLKLLLGQSISKSL